MRSTVMEYGGLHFRAQHSIEERSGIGTGDNFSSAQCMIAKPPPQPELQGFSMSLYPGGQALVSTE